MRKKILVIIVIIFWTAVLIAAYRYFSAKFRQEAIEKDNQRLYDISINDYHIAKYYLDHNKLPNSLAEVASSEKSDNGKAIPLALQDPQTKHEYEYQTVGDDSYKICTTFSTDTLHDRNLADEYTEYMTLQLEKYAKSVYHKKGYDCIELSMSGNNVSWGIKPANFKTTELPDAFTFRSPLNGDRICLGQDYQLSWQSDENTESIGFYLIPPSIMNQPESWLLNAYRVSPGQVVADNETLTKAVLGSFNWKVGLLERFSNNAAPQPVKPGDGYQVGVDITIDGERHTYSSDPFEIANCNVASATPPSPKPNTNN